MNIAIGGDWGGQKGIDDSIFPQRLVVDYVRVFRLRATVIELKWQQYLEAPPFAAHRWPFP